MNTNEQVNYADMIEVPVNTCTVTAVPAPKRRGRRKKQVDNEAIKASLIDTVNKRQEDLFSNDFNPLIPDERDAVLEVVKNKGAENSSNKDLQLIQENAEQGIEVSQNFAEQESAVTAELSTSGVAVDNAVNNDYSVSTITVKDRKKKTSIKGKVLAVSIVVGVVAVATVGGAVLTDSLGLTSYFNGVFSANDDAQVLEYDDYTAYLPCGAEGEVSLVDGVMNITHKGSVYASTDGTVTNLSKEGETFVLEITHGDDFKSVISGIDHAYVVKGDVIFGNIPIGYSNGNGYTVCLYSADGLITEYDISGGTVVWKSTTDGEVA